MLIFITLIIGLCALDLHAEDKIVFDADTVFNDDVVIPERTTCIVKPGVHLFFEGYLSFSVRGLIIAEGTAKRPIVFTSVDRPTGSRQPPTWKGIEIAGSKANGSFRHCRFEGAYRNLVWESSPSFDSCTFAGNHYALYCAKKASPHLSRSLIHRNAYGIAADYAYPILLDNLITENVIGLHLQLSSETISGKNVITGNEKDIHVEKAFGDNPKPSSMQNIWNVMKQLY